jgi:hypothetical protein
MARSTSLSFAFGQPEGCAKRLSCRFVEPVQIPFWPAKHKSPLTRAFLYMAESEGFEPSMDF